MGIPAAANYYQDKMDPFLVIKMNKFLMGSSFLRMLSSFVPKSKLIFYPSSSSILQIYRFDRKSTFYEVTIFFLV